MAVRVAKFGGSSLADVEQFKKVKEILAMDEGRRYVVPSAPGKRFAGDDKVTDLLYEAYECAESGEGLAQRFECIARRYIDIRDGLGVDLDIEYHLEQVLYGIQETHSKDYAASRGEYLNGLLLAAYLGFDFVDPAEAILFGSDGRFDAARTNEALSLRLRRHERAVVHGFYGSLPDGGVKTFSRGGSDITGAIVARAVNADVYENWTDVSGFLMADPRIVEDPKPIETITYRELRELSFMGASVLHDEAIFPVREAGIPIHILNTNRPGDPGTLIVRECGGKKRGAITGVAGKKGFTAITIDKTMMNGELGFGRRILTVLEEAGISFEHMPSGIDTMSVVVQDVNLRGHEDEIVSRIKRECKPDHIELVSGLSLLATVGSGMVSNKGMAARLFGALAGAGVNVRMIDQGSSELNIIVGVESRDFEAAMRAIYAEFVSEA